MSTDGKPLRIAAVGDLHVHAAAGGYRDFFADVSRRTDILALCGDLTHLGAIAEAESLAADLAACSVPVVGVLGNHDYQSGHAEEVRNILGAKMVLLEKETFEYRGIGFAGTKGFCGGFNRYMLTSFGEDAIKQFVNEAVNEALQLENSLRTLTTEHTIVVLHYAPIMGTLQGEPLEILPFLGSSRLAEAIDSFDVTAVFHGHAHHGTSEGHTNKGVPVYNCCYELMQRVHPEQPFALLEV